MNPRSDPEIGTRWQSVSQTERTNFFEFVMKREAKGAQVQLSEYLANIPRLHSWDNGATWNTGGFEASHLQPLFDFLRTRACRRIVETGAGNSTLTFLLTVPERVVSIAPDPTLFERIIAYCDEHRISHDALERHVARSQWVLPKIAAAAPAEFDFALIDGAHGWPYVFIDFFYMHSLLRPGGHVMLDDVQLHSVSELIRWLKKQSEYSLALDLGKAVVFRKDADGAEFPEWNGQPYIIELSRRDVREQLAATSTPYGYSADLKARPETRSTHGVGVTTVPGDSQDMRGRAFLAEEIDRAARSARVVVPLLMKLVRDVRSVVDVGCGAGVWLAQFKEVGVPRVLGLDSSDLEHDQLEIDPNEFRKVGLESEIDLNERFDLCICLDMAHYLSDRTAPTFVQSLCKLSDVVLFSSAIPGQEGAHRINERWPSHWADLFRSCDWEPLDIVRGRVWNDARVEWRYRQNLLLFANKAGLARMSHDSGLNATSPAVYARATPLDIVHPECIELFRGLQVRPVSEAADRLQNNAIRETPKRENSGPRYLTKSYWRNRKNKILKSIKKRIDSRIQ